MEFPKSLMTIKELEVMGFSSKKLREIAQTQGFPIAVREGTGKTAPIKFDTGELMKFLKMQNRILERR